MNLKKIAVIAMMFVFAMSSMAMAAKGGAKMSSPSAAPSVSSPAKSAAPAAPSASQSKEYKPSQDAKSIDKNAPAAAKPSTAAPAQSSSPWGGMMRNIGLFAGGMMLGGLLGSMFGMGTGFMSDILGLLMNVAIFAAAFMLIRMLWSKFRSGKKEENYYQRSAAQEPRQQPMMDVRPPVQNLPGEYNSKTKADEYRNR